MSQLPDRVEEDGTVSAREQCRLLGIARSGLHPVHGSRRLTCLLEREGMTVHRKRLMRLLQGMGIEAIDPKARVSMDGRGRWMDNRMVERLWRSVKYEDVFLRDDANGLELGCGLGRWFREYGERRPHHAPGNTRPAELHRDPASHRDDGGER